MKNLKIFSAIITLIIVSAAFAEVNAQCPQSASFTVKLRTLGGVFISAAQAQPNTQYDVVIQFVGTRPPSTNVAYCAQVALGYSGPVAKDASNGNATFRITTDAVLPPFGILGVYGPTNCSGSCSSVLPNIVQQIQ